ncbi:EscF/YscF/HrpA family type III secretion system needle major subunit [Paraburkholderia sediminicola]|uniref:EscF/YscF/HrpA family type III secretion system needle major subunit n=1 Tax=Paraburkholderia sediminicola TaxID=458836 RepID=UPI0038BB750B
MRIEDLLQASKPFLSEIQANLGHAMQGDLTDPAVMRDIQKFTADYVNAMNLESAEVSAIKQLVGSIIQRI